MKTAGRGKVLIVAYQFPPLGGVGPQRALSLCRYLPEFGVEVHVLTPRNGVSHTYDPTLLKRIPASVRVHRSITPELPYAVRTRLWGALKSARTGQNAGPAPGGNGWGWLTRFGEMAQKALFPDPQRAWTFSAVHAGVRAIREHGIGTVLVTAPPFSSLLIGAELKRRCPEVRLISDFRDEWLDFYIGDVSSGNASWARQKAEQQQRTVIQQSDAIVAVTPSSLHRIRAHCPSELEEKFAYIPNGYDPELTPLCTPKSRKSADKIVVTYLGTVYKPNSPVAYLDALDALPEEIRSRFVTRFIGRIAPEMADSFRGRRTAVEVHDFMPQKEALRFLADSDYVLAAMLDGQTVVAKVYEYLAAAKPILAITPKTGELARVLRETGAGWSADPGEPECVANLIRNAYSAWVERRPFVPDRSAIERYDRRKLAGEFAEPICHLEN